MSTIPASPINESAYELFDRWLEHWQREPHPWPSAGVEPAAAAAPPTQEVGAPPVPASPVAAAPLPRRASGEESGLAVLQTLTEHLVRTSDPFGPAAAEPANAPTTVRTPRIDNERQVGGAILRFPGRVLPTSRPSLTAPWAIPPRAVPGEERLAALASATPTPGLILFSPRPGLRPVLTAGFAVTASCTAIAVAVAWLIPTNTTLALTGALAILTGILWSARTRATGTAVTIEDGVLKITQGEGNHQFPLTGIHPPIDVVGEPGQRGWRVLIQRRGMKPYVVDARMVDPVEFTDAIRRFRPRA